MTPKQLAAIFAANVERLLAAKEWSQGELARQLKVSRGVVSRIASGEYAPAGATIAAVAEAFGVDPHELLLPVPVEKKPAPKKK